MQYVLSVMSNDHPGIVAGVSTAVEQLGGNIISCSQTVLGGYFTFITILEMGIDLEPDELAAKIRSFDELGKEYQVIARRFEQQNNPITKEAQKEDDYDSFVMTAFGNDRPGIIKHFSRFLAGLDINIIDLYGSKNGDEFMLIGQLHIPKTVNVLSLQDDLEEAGKELGFTLKLQHNNIFVATNQLRLSE
ncbi:MAG: glycine cleavage system protein R [Thermoguttaceae bacterium]